MDTAVYNSAEEKREAGKACFFHSNEDKEKRHYGLQLLLAAHSEGDPEATYIVARLLLDGVLKASVEDQTEHALTLLCAAANLGCIQARGFLNAYCQARYQKQMGAQTSDHKGALVDFSGKPIKIDRKGIFTPIDAVLEYKDGRNILTLSANVLFLYGEDIPDPEKFERAVYRGLLAWQGEYAVFGGQKLFVRVNLTDDRKAFDNLIITPLTGEVGSVLQSISSAVASEAKKAEIEDMMRNKRSFASAGLKWSVRSRKLICIQSSDGSFRDYEEIRHVAKHEFGHALGLGDLYASPVDSLEGVSSGTYAELDSYAISEKCYNLVMCDHHGPISNNDVEMVVLAFRENEMQLYQPGKLKGKISYALGRGN